MSTIIDEAVKITSADYNPALPWDRAWDGSPFSDAPEWLEAALCAGKLKPHTRGGTDYAQWDVTTEDGVLTVGPGDYILRGASGSVSACRHDGSAPECAPFEPAEA